MRNQDDLAKKIEKGAKENGSKENDDADDNAFESEKVSFNADVHVNDINYCSLLNQVDSTEKSARVRRVPSL
jgi:hypothetical protein